MFYMKQWKISCLWFKNCFQIDKTIMGGSWFESCRTGRDVQGLLVPGLEVWFKSLSINALIYQSVVSGSHHRPAAGPSGCSPACYTQEKVGEKPWSPRNSAWPGSASSTHSWRTHSSSSSPQGSSCEWGAIRDGSVDFPTFCCCCFIGLTVMYFPHRLLIYIQNQAGDGQRRIIALLQIQINNVCRKFNSASSSLFSFSLEMLDKLLLEIIDIFPFSRRVEIRSS